MELPENYPSDIPKKELSKWISHCAKKATGYSREETEYALANYWNMMTQLGFVELQKRQQENLIEEIKNLNTEIKGLKENNANANRSNKRLSKVTILLAVVTIVLAVVSVGFALTDNYSDKKWKEEQILELKTQNRVLNSINITLKNYIDIKSDSLLTSKIKNEKDENNKSKSQNYDFRKRKNKQDIEWENW